LSNFQFSTDIKQKAVFEKNIFPNLKWCRTKCFEEY